MALAVYFVLRREDRWIVRFEDRNYGHNSLTAALKAAMIAARRSAGHGHEAQIIVRRPDKSWFVTWTSAEDFENADTASFPLSPAGRGLG